MEFYFYIPTLFISSSNVMYKKYYIIFNTSNYYLLRRNFFLVYTKNLNMQLTSKPLLILFFEIKYFTFFMHTF